MKLYHINEAISKMEKHTHGMGMTSYQNDEILLAGGYRSGNSDTEHTRLKYMAYDIKNVSAEDFQADQEKYNVGYVEVFVKDSNGEIDGLVNIHLGTKNRKAGTGKRIIQSLMKTVKGDLKIFDIKKSAIPFWKKMGVVFYNAGFEKPIEPQTTKRLGLRAKVGLYGIIK